MVDDKYLVERLVKIVWWFGVGNMFNDIFGLCSLIFLFFWLVWRWL